MATYDDPYRILCNLRKNFMELDETGFCALFLQDRLPKRKDLFPSMAHLYESEEEERSITPEDYSDWYVEEKDLKTFKCPGYTFKDGELDFPDYDSREENGFGSSDEEYEELIFEREDVNKYKRAGRSLLAYQLAESSPMVRNPFIQYAKYSGSYEKRADTKTFKIFLTMLPDGERDFPITVCIQSYAKVSDLIGLACFKYMADNPGGSVTLKDDLNEYALYIADERGVVDYEFPSLDRNVKVGKFSLQYLGLVELAEINMPKASSTDKNAASSKQEEGNEVFKQVDWEALERFMEDLRVMASVIPESFNVKMLCKRKKLKVLLSISLDETVIQLDSKSGEPKGVPKGMEFPITLDARDIVACEMLKKKSRNRAVFRVKNYVEDVTGEVTYKNNDFQSDIDTADKIVGKLKNVLKLRNSSLRNQYLENPPKEKKSRMSRFFSFFCRRSRR